jgi:hypothetical protein
MALSQLVPLLLPSDPTTVGTEAEQAIARANADAVSLQPLLQQLAQLTAMIEAEAMQMQQTEIMPLVVWDVLNVPGTLPPPTATREEQVAFEVAIQKKVVGEVQEKMVDTFVDMMLRSEQAGLTIWATAVQEGKAKGVKGLVKEAPPPAATSFGIPLPTSGAYAPILIEDGDVPPLSEAPPPTEPKVVELEPAIVPVFSQKDMNDMD